MLRSEQAVSPVRTHLLLAIRHGRQMRIGVQGLRPVSASRPAIGHAQEVREVAEHWLYAQPAGSRHRYKDCTAFHRSNCLPAARSAPALLYLR